MVIQRKLFWKLLTTGFMFLLDLFRGMDGGLKLHVPFFFFGGGGGGLLGDAKVEKWGDHQKKKEILYK